MMYSAPAIDMLVAKSHRMLNMVDVGARGGPVDQWAILKNRARMIGFEPDPEESRRLNEAGTGGMHFIPMLLDRQVGDIDLHVPLSAANASIYKPVRELQEHYPILSFLQPASSCKMPTSTLDIELARIGEPHVDVLKLDTQGSELRIMQGGLRALETCFLIDVEVEFNPQYEGQSLFCDVDRYLRDHGFVLWRLENLVHYAPSIIPAGQTIVGVFAEPSSARWVDVPNGQLFWSQAQYVRSSLPATSREPMPIETAVLAVLAVGIYGFWDLAFEIIRKTGDPSFHEELVQALVSAPLERVPIVAE